jgi:hypothetical protein
MGLIQGLTSVSPFFAILLEFVGEFAQNYNIMYKSCAKKIDKIQQNIAKWVEFFPH